MTRVEAVCGEQSERDSHSDSSEVMASLSRDVNPADLPSRGVEGTEPSTIVSWLKVPPL